MSFVILEFLCEKHGRFESTEIRSSAPDSKPCPECGSDSPWCISAPMGKVRAGEVTRGKSDPPPPGACDTRALAEGMPLHEWKKKRSEERRALVHDEVRRMKG